LWAWGLSFALGGVGSSIVIGGIARALNWPATHRIAWYLVAIAVNPATAGLFFLLTRFFPYTA
jgi:phospholipase/lecithinase/hemolysin